LSSSPDLFPLGDVAVNTIKELLDIHEKEAMELHTKKWSPHLDGYFFMALLPKKRNRTIVYQYYFFDS
jgi:DNA-3-methyladenine glycosylase II